MNGGRVAVVGDALLDRDVEGEVHRLCPDAPVPVLEESATRVRPGGAGLAAALLAADGVGVTLVTALARDPAGAELARLLLGAGIDLLDLGLDGATPEKVRFRCGRSLLRLDRGGAPGRIEASGAGPSLRAALAGVGAVLVSDYGRGLSAHPEARAAVEAAGRRLPLLWDPHPRGAAPVAEATLVTPNRSEALSFRGGGSRDGGDLGHVAARLRAGWRAAAVCVTRGGEGALLLDSAGARAFPTEAVAGDSCGAGDRFAATAARRLAGGDGAATAVAAAVDAATRFVAAGGAARALPRTKPVGPRRRGGGTVVATGGCFDLLHIGHVRGLEAAAALGDRLVVLLNGDRSVHELKGSDRPLVAEEERAAMLRALACVDEVLIFDEPTPREALRRLRPDVWAKGGDYDLEQLPESEEVASWGGRTAILPFHEGRSTSRLIEEVGARVAA